MVARSQGPASTDDQRQERRGARLTWSLVIVVYGCWLLVTWFAASLPVPILLPLGAVLVAWHGSLQHEAIHGHLAPIGWLNALLAWPPLSLWLPYPVYRRNHRAHHRFEILTDPWQDPESFYVDQASWRTFPPVVRALLYAHNTLLGRMVLGPFLAIGQFFAGEARALLAGDRRNLAAWLWHVPAVALILIWVVQICGLSLWTYLGLFVLPGTSLTLLRSFAEHKAANTPFERTAIVDAGRFFSLLFLNNNLHFVHHRRPDLPWYALPRYYRTHRDDLLRENGGLRYREGYGEIAGRFLFRPVDSPAHPFL